MWDFRSWAKRVSEEGRLDELCEEWTYRGDAQTALTMACVKGRPNHVAYLLELGADPNARDAIGRSPLMRCAMGVADGVWKCSDAIESMEALFVAGADLRLADEHGECFPKWAARSKEARMLSWMLEKDASLRDGYIEGGALLHHAADAGSMACARLLVEAGADALALAKWRERPGLIVSDGAVMLRASQVAKASSWLWGRRNNNDDIAGFLEAIEERTLVDRAAKRAAGSVKKSAQSL